MSRWVTYLFVFFLGGLTAVLLAPSFFSHPASVPIPKQAAISEGAASVSTIKVSRVIDGDTIELVDGRRVRYIGMDTPEMGDNRKQVQCFAREATEENKRLVEGKTIRLEKDVSETDKYGRLLRYVYVDNVLINDYLVRQGFARVATFPPDISHQEQFLAAEREAREQKKGLWNTCIK